MRAKVRGNEQKTTAEIGRWKVGGEIWPVDNFLKNQRLKLRFWMKSYRLKTDLCRAMDAVKINPCQERKQATAWYILFWADDRFPGLNRSPQFDLCSSL
jgi:hypothetical protein